MSNKVHKLESVVVSSIEILNNKNKVNGDKKRYKLEILSYKDKVKGLQKGKVIEKTVWVGVFVFALEVNDSRKIIFHTTVYLKDINHRLNTYSWRGELCRRFLSECVSGYAVFAGEYIDRNG